jgi:hypothetical protein
MKSDARGTNSRSADGETPTLPRTIDLYGRTPGGRPMLWKRAVQVVPATAFDAIGRWIRSGHYIIDHNGDAIVVHCGNMEDGSVSVQFMLDELTQCCLPRETVESMLLGKVVVSEEQQAAVFEGRRLSDFFAGCGSPSVARPTIANQRRVRRKPKSSLRPCEQN